MGTEAFWVPVALSALSEGANYANQTAATSRANSAETQNILQQQQLRSKAQGEVGALTSQIASNSPTQLAATATGDYVSQLRKNAAGSVLGGSTSSSPTTYGASTSSLPTSVNGSSRYAAGLPASQQQVEDYGNQYAGEMGNIDAAVRQRQNEGLATQTLATGLNGLNLQSYGANFVNQLRAQTAGQANPWVSLFAGMLGSGAKSYSKTAGGSGSAVNPWLMPNAGGYGYGQNNPLDAGNDGYGATAPAVA